MPSQPQPPLQQPTGLAARLRHETRDDHAAVDAAYGRFDLGQRDGYAAFLTAHASVLPALEALLEPGELVPHWRGRAEALAQDLVDLGLPAPVAQSVELPDGTAARWGAIYVLEGSRLGGVVLSRRVPEGLPSRFLDSAHPAGAWRDLLVGLDRAGERSPDAAAEAVEAARQVFREYVRAASLVAA